MSEVMNVDLLVLGAGITGMSAAGYAASQGASVVVVERAGEIGGSAVLSNGTVWTAETQAVAREVNPEGDPELVRTLVGNYEDAIRWLQSTGVEMTSRQPLDSIMGYPAVGYTIDVLDYMRRMRSNVLAAGGWVGTSAEIESLILENGQVCGGIVRDRDGLSEIRAPWTLLASGGFQNDPELRAKYIGNHAADMLVRSNQQSNGTGLRLGISAGAALSEHMDSFYGHTMPYPLARKIEPRDYVRLAQLYSQQSVMLDRLGRRFVDESIGYHNNARAVNAQDTGRAILVADDAVRKIDRGGHGVGEQIDRPTEAMREGANVIEAETLAEIDASVFEWGYEGVALAVSQFNDQVTSAPEQMIPARRWFRKPLDQPPFFAMEVQPAITFTMGGLRIDPTTRVLREDGSRIPGLLAAGADAGGLYHDAYLGGLSMGVVFGRQAARVALGEI